MTSLIEYATGVSQNWVATAFAALVIAAYGSEKRKKWMTPNNDELNRHPVNVKTVLLLGMIANLLMFALVALLAFRFFNMANSNEPITRLVIADFCVTSALIIFSLRSAIALSKTLWAAFDKLASSIKMPST